MILLKQFEIGFLIQGVSRHLSEKPPDTQEKHGFIKKKNVLSRNMTLKLKRQQHYSDMSPYFQTAQFQSNVLIHLISYVMHVVALDLDDQ